METDKEHALETSSSENPTIIDLKRSRGVRKKGIEKDLYYQKEILAKGKHRRGFKTIISKGNHRGESKERNRK